MAEQLPPLTRRSRPKGRASILAGETKNAAPPAAADAPAEPDTTTFEFPAVAPDETAPAAARAPRPSRPASEGKVQLGVKVSEDLKGRARAAYKEAAYHEDVTTFHQFVAQALEAEIRRIELAYKDGQRLEPRSENLRRGRPAL